MLPNIVQGESSQFSREVLQRTWVSKGREGKKVKGVLVRTKRTPSLHIIEYFFIRHVSLLLTMVDSAENKACMSVL